MRRLPDRNRPGRAGPDLRRRRRRRAALPRVWCNPVAGQGRCAVKVIVEADGGSRGNPGPAGYGSVVWSADHSTVLAESKQAIGRATNNVAEYRGLIAGLEEAAKVGATEVDVSMDSKLVVEQMSGRWKVKHPRHGTAVSTGHGAVDEIRSASPTPGSRGRRTAHADRLANEAMDAAAELEVPAEVPKARKRLQPRRVGPAPRRADPIPAAAARADRVVGAAPVFGPGEPGADRRRTAAGRGRRPVPWPSGAGSPPSSPRRCSARTTPPRPRPRRWARRHRRRRPDRDRLRRLGRA